MKITRINKPIAWRSDGIKIQNHRSKIAGDRRNPRELDLLGAATLRRDGWRPAGLFWIRDASDNPIPDSKVSRFAEREPMNRRRRRARRKGRDRTVDGHQLSDRMIIAQRAAQEDAIDRLMIYGDQSRVFVWNEAQRPPASLCRPRARMDVHKTRASMDAARLAHPSAIVYHFV